MSPGGQLSSCSVASTAASGLQFSGENVLKNDDNGESFPKHSASTSPPEYQAQFTNHTRGAKAKFTRIQMYVDPAPGYRESKPSHDSSQSKVGNAGNNTRMKIIGQSIVDTTPQICSGQLPQKGK
ncbi:uncharacterized protein BDR25DRAFT_363574 [Lindgomyces ingoldianus]|uniref:Uncharacterized protein n=1 Tax=Lindgomyces ingoldianus TaxID=673940 RepID=A0ACB6Q8Q0_9PLEO|nr:uncharacterized protein BDR25DRAFT_363574 [Lindgomyces ingoldianus]KAF2462732.1 hypothetical protein BDR25DRAFT_363574 [Lindgomyces ingoldianus]